VIEPFVKRRRPAGGGFGSAASKIVGVARVGQSIKCVVPKLGGDPYKVSYSWQNTSSLGFVDIPGATKQSLKITRSIYRRAQPESRRVACTAVARNAGGSLQMFSGSVPLHK
jgi:hypothetical protein